MTLRKTVGVYQRVKLWHTLHTRFIIFFLAVILSLHKLEIVVARANVLAMSTCLSGSIGRSM